MVAALVLPLECVSGGKVAGSSDGVLVLVDEVSLDNGAVSRVGLDLEEGDFSQGSLLSMLKWSIDAAAVPAAGIGLKVLLISSLEDVIDGRRVSFKGTPRDVLASPTEGVVNDPSTSRLDSVSDGRFSFPLCRDCAALRDDGNIAGLLDTEVL
ncbi:hypothetical protein CEP51_016821, partial [Fusarium floridanum]